jgi:hypothetical protein
MYSYFNPFEQGRYRQRSHHRSFGPPPFGLDNGNGCGPHEHGDYPPFQPFGPHGGFGLHGGRGGFEPWGPSGPRGRGWGPRDQDDYSSRSEDEDPKKPGEDTSSDSSSDSSSESDVECHGKGRHRRCPHRRGGHGRHGGGHSHGGHGHGGHDHGGHGRHRHGRHGHCLPPHHHHHHRGHSPWGNRAETTEDLPVEDASGFGSDYQVIQDDVVTQMNNLRVQDDGHKDQSTKKSFKVALNADGFKVKDIRIRRHQNQLRVEGKQNAKTYLGTFQRSFAYTITIPSGVNPKKIKTKLGPDGVLRIKAMKSRDGTENEEIEEISIKE